MKPLTVLFMILCVLNFISCTEQILGEDPPDAPSDNFTVLWNDFDMHYARFTYKNIAWDSLYSVYYPQIHSGSTDEELFNVLALLLDHLKDTHAVLESPFRYYHYYPQRYVQNFNFANVKARYLQNARTQKAFTYGQLSAEIGYIHVSTFDNSGTDYSFIDNILTELQSGEGIVIDVRNNGGGDESNAKTVAGRFADRERLYCTMKYRNGPSHDDFSDPVRRYVAPSGNSHFSGNVVLLTNRNVGSAAEDFVLMMREMPAVTVVGDTTTGSSGGSPVTKELPNGWLYRIPTAMQFTTRGEVFEGVGIAPDTALWISITDERQGRDTFIEKALAILQ